MLEAICDLLLIVSQMTEGATLILMLLLIVFMVAPSASLIRVLDINFGCFSLPGTSRPSLVWALIQDMFVLPLAVWIYSFNLGWIHRQKALEPDAG